MANSLEAEGQTEGKEPLSQDQLGMVDDIKAQPESVRDTMERTLKEGEPAALEIPKDFDDDDKKFWSATDRATQEYLLKRHNRYTEGVKKTQDEFGAYRKTWDPVAKLMEPYAEVLKSQNLTADQVIQRYVNAELYLQKSPVDGLLWLMHRYGVDPEKLTTAFQEVKDGKRKIGQQQQQQQQQQQKVELDPNDPRDKAILELQEKDRQRERARLQSMQNEVETATKTFEEAKDKDGALLYPHAKVPEIKRMMGILFSSGEVNIAKAGGIGPALKQAYETAVFTHVPTREALLKAQNDAEAKRKDEENRNRIAKARTASQGATGTSSSGSAPAARRGSSVRDSLQQTAAAIGYNNQ